MGKKRDEGELDLSAHQFLEEITDYGAEDEMMADPDMERKGTEIDDAVGVAVVFDEEE